MERKVMGHVITGKKNDAEEIEMREQKEDRVTLHIKGKVSPGTELIYQLTFFDHCAKEHVWQEEKILPEKDHHFEIRYFFDPISLGIYQGAENIKGKLVICSETGEYCLNVFSFEKESENSPENRKNIAVQEEKQGIGTDENPRHYGSFGRKNGIKEQKSYRKVLFVGNSLLLGMCNRYGMCASSPKKDYAWYVEQALRKEAKKQGGITEEQKVEIRKVHGAAYEQAETPEQADAWFDTTQNCYTHKPAKESFTEDLDLIILQLSDNINSRSRAENFGKTVDDFVKRIKTSSPNADILWVYGWFNRNLTADRIMQTCEKYRMIWVDISDLHTTENEGFHGQSYEAEEGKIKEVPDLWITHPGDLGMKEITDRVLEALGIKSD